MVLLTLLIDGQGLAAYDRWLSSQHG
jgi:hypothetical protein